MSQFPLPPWRALVGAALAGAVAAYWLSPHTSAVIALGVLYGSLVVVK